MVPKVGLEPTRPCGLQILSLARLPISPLRPEVKDKYISAKRKKIKRCLSVLYWNFYFLSRATQG